MAFCYVRHVLRYSRGYQKADTSRNTSGRNETHDATAALQREVTERAKEQRRQHAADEERKISMKNWQYRPMLMLLSVLAVAANYSSKAVQRQLVQEVKPAGFPLLPQQAARAETEYCSPLLGVADDLAGKFAKEADERYVAGSTCERTSDKVTGQN